jgi:hypothetical protein
MRQFLLAYIPDPGAVIFLALGAVVLFALYRMATYEEVTDPVADEFTPRALFEPEPDARRRQL